MFWRIVNALQLAFTALWTAGCITFAGAIYLVLRDRGVAIMLARRLWAPVLMFFAGARLRVSGAVDEIPPDPVIFVSNHQSIIDICALFRGLPRPVRFVAKRELGRIPFLGWYIRAMGMVFVDRRGRGRGVVDAMVGLLRSGSDVIAFPEGTRTRDGSIATFRRGPFEAALVAGARLVPVAIRGAHAVLPAGGFHPRPGLIELVIGEPLEVLPGEGREAIAARAEQVVRGLYAGLGPA